MGIEWTTKVCSESDEAGSSILTGAKDEKDDEAKKGSLGSSRIKSTDVSTARFGGRSDDASRGGGGRSDDASCGGGGRNDDASRGGGGRSDDANCGGSNGSDRSDGDEAGAIGTASRISAASISSGAGEEARARSRARASKSSRVGVRSGSLDSSDKSS
jgi:hypothetical protein